MTKARASEAGGRLLSLLAVAAPDPGSALARIELALEDGDHVASQLDVLPDQQAASLGLEPGEIKRL